MSLRAERVKEDTRKSQSFFLLSLLIHLFIIHIIIINIIHMYTIHMKTAKIHSDQV